MEKKINQLTIEKVMNGYQVFLEDYRYNGTVRPVPFVFETMENLLKFVEEKFEKQ